MLSRAIKNLQTSEQKPDHLDDGYNVEIYKSVYFTVLSFMICWRGLYFYSSQTEGLYQGLLFDQILPLTWTPLFKFSLSLVVLETTIALILFSVWPAASVALAALFYVNLFGPTNNYLQPFDDNIILPNLTVLFFSYLPKDSWFWISAGNVKKLLIANISIVYLSAFIAKIVRTGWIWGLGETIQLYLYERSFQTQSIYTLILADSSTLCALLSSLVLLFEATFWITIWVGPIISAGYICFGFFMHLSILIFMDINFFRFFFISYLIFVPYKKIANMLGFAHE